MAEDAVRPEGPFLYALPNLAGTCPFSCSEDTNLFCSFSGAGDSNAPPANPHHHHHHDRCCHSPAVTSCRCSCCCHHDPPSDSEDAEPSTAYTKEEGVPDTESPLPPPQTPIDKIHFELDDIISSPVSPIEGGTEPEQQQQQQEPQSSEPSTSTRSNALSSSTRFDFFEGPKEERGKGEEVREKKKGEGRRKRQRTRKQGRDRSLPAEHGVSSIPPHFMGLSGIHYGLWTQYVCPQAPPPPAMNHHTWPFSGYHHHNGGGFVVPPNSPVPLFWNPMVPATGFVGVPVAS